jgi:hypothetical protein
MLLASFAVGYASEVPYTMESEPNDTKETSTYCETRSVSGGVGVEGDTEDWYFMPGIQGEIFITFIPEMGPEDLQFEVYSYNDLLGTGSMTVPVIADMPGKCYLRVTCDGPGGGYIIHAQQHVSDPIVGFPDMQKVFSCHHW